MRLNVNHVAEIYVTEQRQWAHVEKSYQKQTNDDSETDSDDIEIVGAVLERGEAAESDDCSHIVQPYRFEPYLAMPDGVDSTTATRVCTTNI